MPGDEEPWRIGQHYGIHVYEKDRPVATFHHEEDARRCVDALAAVERVRALADEWEKSPVSGLPYDIATGIRRALDGGQ